MADRYGTERCDPYSANGRYRLWARAVASGVDTATLASAYNVTRDTVMAGARKYERRVSANGKP